MIKRTISIAIAAGLMSALLLLGGTAVMSRISPVSAAQFPALIAGQSGRASDSVFQPVDSKTLDPSQDGKAAIPEASNILSASPQVSASALAAPRAQPTSSTSMQPGPAAAPKPATSFRSILGERVVLGHFPNTAELRCSGETRVPQPK